MIQYISGILAHKSGDHIVVDRNGMGYKVFVPSNAVFFKRREGEEIKVYTSMEVREDDISLFGFGDMGSLELFHKLITVNSVGCKAAISILSVMTFEEASMAIVSGDLESLCRANGIGKKTAQKIILELKDRIDPTVSRGISEDIVTQVVESSNRNVALEGLISLGYSRTEAVGCIGKMDDGLSVEEYIKEALKTI